jgi:hypothetical protein
VSLWRFTKAAVPNIFPLQSPVWKLFPSFFLPLSVKLSKFQFKLTALTFQNTGVKDEGFDPPEYGGSGSWEVAQAPSHVQRPESYTCLKSSKPSGKLVALTFQNL